jgi:VanZ family protein
MQDLAPRGLTPVRRVWALAAAAWALAIVVFGVIPTHEALAATVGNEESLVASLGHFAEYAVFAVLLAMALGGRRIAVRPFALAATLAVALGWGIELVQRPLPYRDFQVSDGIVDMAGVAAGLAAFSAVVLWGERRRRARPG